MATKLKQKQVFYSEDFKHHVRVLLELPKTEPFDAIFSSLEQTINQDSHFRKMEEAFQKFNEDYKATVEHVRNHVNPILEVNDCWSIHGSTLVKNMNPDFFDLDIDYLVMDQSLGSLNQLDSSTVKDFTPTFGSKRIVSFPHFSADITFSVDRDEFSNKIFLQFVLNLIARTTWGQSCLFECKTGYLKNLKDDFMFILASVSNALRILGINYHLVPKIYELSKIILISPKEATEFKLRSPLCGIDTYSKVFFHDDSDDLKLHGPISVKQLSLDISLGLKLPDILPSDLIFHASHTKIAHKLVFAKGKMLDPYKMTTIQDPSLFKQDGIFRCSICKREPISGISHRLGQVVDIRTLSSNIDYLRSNYQRTWEDKIRDDSYVFDFYQCAHFSCPVLNNQGMTKFRNLLECTQGMETVLPSKYKGIKGLRSNSLIIGVTQTNVVEWKSAILVNYQQRYFNSYEKRICCSTEQWRNSYIELEPFLIESVIKNTGRSHTMDQHYVLSQLQNTDFCNQILRDRGYLALLDFEKEILKYGLVKSLLTGTGPESILDSFWELCRRRDQAYNEVTKETFKTECLKIIKDSQIFSENSLINYFDKRVFEIEMAPKIIIVLATAFKVNVQILQKDGIKSIFDTRKSIQNILESVYLYKGMNYLLFIIEDTVVSCLQPLSSRELFDFFGSKLDKVVIDQKISEQKYFEKTQMKQIEKSKFQPSLSKIKGYGQKIDKDLKSERGLFKHPPIYNKVKTDTDHDLLETFYQEPDFDYPLTQDSYDESSIGENYLDDSVNINDLILSSKDEEFFEKDPEGFIKEKTGVTLGSKPELKKKEKKIPLVDDYLDKDQVLARDLQKLFDEELAQTLSSDLSDKPPFPIKTKYKIKNERKNVLKQNKKMTQEPSLDKKQVKSYEMFQKPFKNDGKVLTVFYNQEKTKKYIDFSQKAPFPLNNLKLNFPKHQVSEDSLKIILND
jgi:hypothetical protein